MTPRFRRAGLLHCSFLLSCCLYVCQATRKWQVTLTEPHFLSSLSWAYRHHVRFLLCRYHSFIGRVWSLGRSPCHERQPVSHGVWCMQPFTTFLMKILSLFILFQVVQNQYDFLSLEEHNEKWWMGNGAQLFNFRKGQKKSLIIVIFTTNAPKSKSSVNVRQLCVTNRLKCTLLFTAW